jgi:PAS domain S-box-containing protein
LEISPTAIVTLGLDRKVTSWNLAAEDLFGFTAAEAIGHNLEDLVANQEDLHAEYNTYLDELAPGERFHAVTRRSRKDGTLVDVDLFAVLVTAEDELTGYLVIYYDISALKDAEKRYRDPSSSFCSSLTSTSPPSRPRSTSALKSRSSSATQPTSGSAIPSSSSGSSTPTIASGSLPTTTGSSRPATRIRECSFEAEGYELVTGSIDRDESTVGYPLSWIPERLVAGGRPGGEDGVHGQTNQITRSPTRRSSSAMSSSCCEREGLLAQIARVLSRSHCVGASASRATFVFGG